MDPQKTQRKIWHRDQIGSTASVIQTQTLLTRSLVLDDTALILVRQGSKRVSWEHHDLLLTAGDAVLVTAACPLDVTNILSAHTGTYAADWLSFPGSLSAAMPHALYNLSDSFRSAFDHTAAAIIDSTGVPARVAAKRMEEMTLWLEDFGVRLAPAKTEKLSLKVRKLVAGDPAREWLAAEVAQHFAMSEATFRRRLSMENAAFQQLLTEVRMCHALTLLQVTDLSVTQVALAVGYESPSKFTVRFRSRFGFNPGQIHAKMALA
ncbi:helix-turn-helix transcriptional regulator [Pantoea sp. App145]|uniref:helix-turn-helix transcriptional regulator n=1 Tax=Pantoea sp. App145 TaxID=3071567 RepID=UPI003A7F74F1